MSLEIAELLFARRKSRMTAVESYTFVKQYRQGLEEQELALALQGDTEKTWTRGSAILQRLLKSCKLFFIVSARRRCKAVHRLIREHGVRWTGAYAKASEVTARERARESNRKQRKVAVSLFSADAIGNVIQVALPKDKLIYEE